MGLNFQYHQPDLSDSDLIFHYREQQDYAALALLFKRHSWRVYGWCLHFLKNERDCEDAVMDIFIIVQLELNKHYIATFDNWLFVTTRNYCLRQLRQSARFNDLFTSTGDWTEEQATIVPEENAVDQTAAAGQQMDALSQAVDELDEQQRQCIVLHYFEGLSYRAICDRTSYDINAVRSYIQNGRRNLRNQLRLTL